VNDDNFITISISALNAAVRLLFGEQSVDMLRKTYEAMEAVEENASKQSWYNGYTEGRIDEAEWGHDANLTEAPRGDAMEEDMADAAQITMDELWGAAAEGIEEAFDTPPRIHAHPEGSTFMPAQEAHGARVEARHRINGGYN
jgi:hypothetical protein